MFNIARHHHGYDVHDVQKLQELAEPPRLPQPSQLEQHDNAGTHVDTVMDSLVHTPASAPGPTLIDQTQAAMEQDWMAPASHSARLDSAPQVATTTVTPDEEGNIDIGNGIKVDVSLDPPAPPQTVTPDEEGNIDIGNGIKVDVSLDPPAPPQTPPQPRPIPRLPRLNTRVVTNMKENFDFFEQSTQEVLKPEGPEGDLPSDLDADDVIDPHVLAERLEEFTLSTAYSGIGAPEATLFILRNHLQEICGRKMKHPKILHQVEFDDHCRAELMLYEELDRPQPNRRVEETCCFGDLCSFFVDSLQDTVKELKKRPDLALEILAAVIASGEAVKTSSHCYVHARECHMPLELYQNSPRTFD